MACAAVGAGLGPAVGAADGLAVGSGVGPQRGGAVDGRRGRAAPVHKLCVLWRVYCAALRASQVFASLI